jgi:hypothetical protein
MGGSCSRWSSMGAHDCCTPACGQAPFALTHDVPPATVVAGVPATVIKTL